MIEIGKEYKQKYDYLILLSCAEWYTNPIVNNMASLKRIFRSSIYEQRNKRQTRR